MNWTKRYFDELVQLSSAPLILDLKMFPNAKEITESMGMFNAIRQYTDLALNGGYNCIVVGDGHTPRTASLMAVRTNYECFSVDPVMREKPSWGRIKRLYSYRNQIENMYFSMDKHTILMLPHSHVSIKTCLDYIKAPSFTIVSMDCCFDNSDIGVEPDIEYTDNAVWSPKNKIKIWKCYKNV